MLPAAKPTDLANTGKIHNVHEGGTAAISKNGAFHMGRLDLSSSHLNLAIRSNKSLSDIQRAAISLLDKSKEDIDVVLLGGGADQAHLWGVDFQTGLDVLLD